MKNLQLPSGEQVPAFGMGTWRMGEVAGTRAEEIATLRLGLDLGARVIDTAEMYGEGKAEELVGQAIAGRREEVFLVSKVYPYNATRHGVPAACDRSLRRLKTDHLDLYLLHWRGQVPLAETLEAFMELRDAGKIRSFGVSNFNVGDMEELWEAPGGRDAAVDQVLFNLARRGVEYDLLPWLRERKLVVMAYSPIEQARLLQNAELAGIAQAWGMTPAQAALAWLLARDGVMVIPKTASRERLRENLGALDQPLDAAQRAELDRLFPPPRQAQPLEML